MNFRYKVILDNFIKETGYTDARWVKGWEGFYVVRPNGEIFKKNKFNEIFKRLAVSDNNIEYARVSLVDGFGGKRKQTVLKENIIYTTFVGEIPDKHIVVRVDFMDDSHNLSNLKVIPYDSCRPVIHFVNGVKKKVFSSLNEAALELGLRPKEVAKIASRKMAVSNLDLRYGG